MVTISPYLLFLLSAIFVVIAANQLAKYGDIIAVRTQAGGLLVGTILLAGATSLPEMLASISAFRQNTPDLAAGNFLGSNMVNIMLLAILDLLNYQVPLIRRDALNQTMTAVLGILLTAVAVVFIEAKMNIVIGWIGLDSLILIGLYFAGVWLIQAEGRASIGAISDLAVKVSADFPSLRQGIIGFVLSAGGLMLVVPLLVQASGDIAESSGLGATFVGTALLSLVTSLPELLAAYAAVRLNALDLAVGNLFGSVVFNMLGLGLADLFYPGSLLFVISQDFALVGMLSILLTTLAVMGNLGRLERRIWFIEIDALVIMLTYLAGMYLLFQRGLSG